MIVKVIPIRVYDFEMFKTFARDQYGIDILPARFAVDIHDYENPRCGNCDCIIRGAYENRCVRPRYCINCGAEMKWPIDYIGIERQKEAKSKVDDFYNNLESQFQSTPKVIQHQKSISSIADGKR